jgi:hypothetical protein
MSVGCPSCGGAPTSVTDLETAWVYGCGRTGCKTSAWRVYKSPGLKKLKRKEAERQAAAEKKAAEEKAKKEAAKKDKNKKK